MKYKLRSYFAKFKVKGVAFDSRKVKHNDAFFAIKGDKYDGNYYVDQAIAKGAVLVFTDDPNRNAINGDGVNIDVLNGDVINRVTSRDDNIIYLSNIRYALALAAGIIYPNLPKKLIAVTGTNGKTSVVSYCQQLLELMGVKSAAIGTIGITANEEIKSQLSVNVDSELTTADPITFRKILHELSYLVDVVAFEASSHGIEQDRLGNVQVNAAAFTSFSQDHLDYHKTMDNYLAVKLKLFSKNLIKDAKAVISKDINFKAQIIKYFTSHNVKFIETGGTVVSINDVAGNEVSRNVGSSINLIESSVSGQIIDFTRGKKQYNFKTAIIGSFQATNLLIAAEILASIGYEFDHVATKLTKVKPVSGRLQKITSNKVKHIFHVFVDYAHTPDALKKSLEELSKLKKATGRLVVLIGCGGDRDKAKRPIMGEIAVKIANLVIITDDNPRNEDPAKIRLAIIQGARNHGIKSQGIKTDKCQANASLNTSKIANRENIIEIANRKIAIESAIDLLQKDDILLIAGKGNEDYQIIGDEKTSFSDIEIAEASISKFI